MLNWFSIAAAEEAAETAAAPEAAKTWLQTLVEKFAETPSTLWIAVAVVAALALMGLAITRSSKQWNARMIAYGALSIALSFVLSCFKFYEMPQGGSITPGSMLPVMLFSAAFGVGPGLLAGLTYGVLQYLQGGWFLNVWQFALDYLLAFAALGLAGLAEKLPKAWGLYLAMLIAALGRAVSATLAGIMFWEATPWASLVYNGTYLVPEVIICMVLALVVGSRLMKMMKSGR